VQLRILRGVHC